MAGKGSAPRKGANQKAYEANWANIFGEKNENKKSNEEVKQDDKISSNRQGNQSSNRQEGKEQ
jgi:hypothetical protein